MLFSVVGTAQTIFDFEGDAPAFNDFGAITTIIDNPDISAPNESAKVAQTVNGVLQDFSGVNIPQAIDITIDKGFTMQVWSPTTNIPVLLKLEGAAGEPSVERLMMFTATAGTWQELSFNFTGETVLTFPSISIFINFNTPDSVEQTYYWDNLVQDQAVVVTTPLAAAPTPTRDAADVISIFSDAYTDVTVDTFETEWSEGTLVELMIEGNPTLKYENLNFIGIETVTEQVDLATAEMTHIHLDYWSANGEGFGVKLVDFGADGAFDGGDDSEFQIDLTGLSQGSWNTIELPLNSFTGLTNRSNIAQYVLVGLPTDANDVFIDNIYFYNAGELLTQVDLPVTFDEAGVDYGLAGFGGTDGLVVVDPTDNTNMVGQATKTAGAQLWAGVTMTSISGNPDGFVTRIAFSAEETVISTRVWSPTAGTPVRMKVEKADDPTVSVETEVMTTMAGAWETVEFDFANEVTGTAAINFASIYNKASIFFDFGSEPTEAVTYYWDDVIFTGDGGGGGGDDTPMVAAPTPTRDEVGVISMFSNAYTDVAVDTWRTDWSEATLSDIQIEGNDTKQYAALNFAGVETIGSPIDLTGAEMTHLHVDYWTTNMDLFRIKLVDFGGDGFDNGTDTEFEIEFATTKNQWVGLDIPLEDFVGMEQEDINQFIISGAPIGTIFLDNVYYYNDLLDGVNTPVLGLLEVFPNPINDRVNITAPARMQTLSLYSTSGQLVGQWTPNAERFDIDMGHLAPGMYVALVATADGMMTVKLIKE
ncbi:MAG: hypothetical protein ACJAZ9_000161 [Neolewinella sp.]|jgi:hypothetical protein